MWKSIDVEYLDRYGYDCPEDLQKSIEGMSFSETAAYFKERFELPDSWRKSKRPGRKCPLKNTEQKCP